MKSKFIDKQICYDGTQLRSHWIMDTTGIVGDAIVSFIGPADVSTKHMVDLVDVRDNAPIFSKSMLHFIVEHFDSDLTLTIARQRILIAIAFEVMNSSGLRRTNNDIYLGKKKASVAIATSSPISTLIHFGINVTSEDTPVITTSLDEIGIDPEQLSKKVMNRYCNELESMYISKCKVRTVL